MSNKCSVCNRITAEISQGKCGIFEDTEKQNIFMRAVNTNEIFRKERHRDR